MSLALLLPAGLAALAALLLPLLLHLDRQAQATPTDFAALRWLSARLRPRRRLRLREWWLLLLRLLLVATVALLFARPVLFGSEGGRPWVLVAPGADLAQARRALPLPSAQWHWLAPGFPAITARAPAASDSGAALASLLREIDARLPASTAVTVFVPERIGGLDGERPRLARRVAWRILPSAASPAKPAVASLAPQLVVRYGDQQQAALRYLRAASLAWGGGIDAAAITRALPARARWLVWLAPGELPAALRDWVDAGGTIVLDAQSQLPTKLDLSPVWRDDDGAVLAAAASSGRGRVVRLSRALRPDSMPILLEPEFPTRLRALFEAAAAPPQLAAAQALQPLPGGPVFPETPLPIDRWLMLVAAALFVLERWFASASRGRLDP